MNSSSSQDHDVFLSFRGLDTRHTFTGDLYRALSKNDIKTYIDNELQPGDEIGPALLTAIEQAKISVVVFSENYASSKWCLDELVHIMKCKLRYGRIVLPVFYKIEPSVVRYQNGSFADPFVKHEKHLKNNMDKVLIWKDYLKAAAALSGYDSQNYRCESALVDAIVKQISKKLKCISSTKSRGLFGIESQIQQIESLLSIKEQDVPIRYVGIWGMSGVGKTTLANEVFLRLSSEFDSCSFVPNVRQESKKYGIHHVRSTLIGDLLGDSLDIGSEPLGSKQLDKLSRMKVLIVLDDVKDSSQIDVLLGDEVVFRWGSRIIITSSDKRPLMDKVNDEHIYSMKELEIDDALQLFHSKASQDLSKRDCLDLSRKAVEIARGIPLLLTIMSLEFGHCKTRRDWEHVLNRLQEIPNKKVEDVLRACYNGLQDDEKGIFLDIACFLKGEKKVKAERRLETHGFSAERGIQSLVDKCFISISKDEHLEMHALMQQMGRSIVREECTNNPGKRSRLWNADDVYQVLKNEENDDMLKLLEKLFCAPGSWLRWWSGPIRIQHEATELEAICSDISAIQELRLRPYAFRNMPKLLVLRFYAEPEEDTILHLPGGLKYLPEDLRYLYWERYPSKSLPSESFPHNLVELHLPNGKVKKLWNSNGKNLANLKRLNLKGCEDLTEVPDLSTQCPNIEKLNLSGCWSLKISRASPKMPRNLQKLDLSYSDLTEVPDLSGCPNIEKLNLHHCDKLVRLPNGYLKHLAKLKTLNLAHCSSLTTSPVVPRNLETLDVSSCSKLTKVPEFPQRSNIKTIDLCGCRSLKQLPVLKALKKLTDLELAKCSSLKDCPYLPGNIQRLDMSSCTELSEVSHLSNYKCRNIEKIDLCHCTGLEELPMLEHLDKLTHLELAGCSSLEVCPKLPSKIRHLDLSGCSRLTRLPDLSGCPDIELLDLCECTSLTEISYSDFRNLDKLTDLYLENCSSLQVFPEIPKNVRILHAPSCSKVTKFPDISWCSNIERIDLTDCKRLNNLPEYVEDLKFFQYPDIEIDLSGCKRLMRITPSLPSVIRKRY